MSGRSFTKSLNTFFRAELSEFRPATTDNSLFRYYDVPAFGLIPAVLSEELIKSVHSINERLPVLALTQGLNIYTKLLLRLELEGAQKRKRLLNAELRKLHLTED